MRKCWATEQVRSNFKCSPYPAHISTLKLFFELALICKKCAANCIQSFWCAAQVKKVWEPLPYNVLTGLSLLLGRFLWVIVFTGIWLHSLVCHKTALFDIIYAAALSLLLAYCVTLKGQTTPAFESVKAQQMWRKN